MEAPKGGFTIRTVLYSDFKTVANPSPDPANYTFNFTNQFLRSIPATPLIFQRNSYFNITAFRYSLQGLRGVVMLPDSATPRDFLSLGFETEALGGSVADAPIFNLQTDLWQMWTMKKRPNDPVKVFGLNTASAIDDVVLKVDTAGPVTLAWDDRNFDTFYLGQDFRLVVQVDFVFDLQPVSGDNS